MSFSIGIVGLPNVGKSTLFKALTKKQVDAANYPFCTIDPNVGTVAVPDHRLDKLAALYNSEKVIPTTIEFVDIAGLVAGAHKGEGLGNQFLSHIREVDAIAHVMRHFSDGNVTHVAGKVDPESDRETILLELIFADIQTLEKVAQRLEKQARGQDKEAAHQLAIIKQFLQTLENNQLTNTIDVKPEDAGFVKSLNLLTRKPMLHVLNVDEDNMFQETDYIPISAKIESELSELSPEEAKEYLKDIGLEQSGLDRFIVESYKLLNLITFFTAGPKETKAWTLRKGSTAPQAAGEIHTDFEKGFIRAEVIPWDKLVEAGNETQAKEKGLMRLEGKDYIVQDGDTCHFRFSV